MLTWQLVLGEAEQASVHGTCVTLSGDPHLCAIAREVPGDQSPAQSVVIPKITATGTTTVRALAHLVLPAAPAAGVCCSHCPQFSPLKTQELSHFLNLHGWQVAEQDENQAQDLGLCCTGEGQGTGGGGHVTRERQGPHLSSLGFTSLARGCMSDHPAFPVLWREGPHSFTLSQELALWGSGGTSRPASTGAPAMCGHQPCPDPLFLPCPTGCSKSDVFCHLWCLAVAPLPADTLQPWGRAGVFTVLASGLPPLIRASPHRDP